MRYPFFAMSCVLAICLLGCKQPTSQEGASDPKKKAEEEIKQAFASLQSAIKAKDVDKIWDLLAKDSREDCEREAKEAKALFAKAADKELFKDRYKLTAEELSQLTGKLYVKSKAFFDGETDEMPDSRFDKVTDISGDSAKLHYTEDGGKGHKEERKVVREDGKWRFVLEVNSAPNPTPKAKAK